MDLVDSETDSYAKGCSACGRTFGAPGAYQNHLRGCKTHKKRFRETLTTVKGIIARKRQRRDEAIDTASQSNVGLRGNVVNARKL